MLLARRIEALDWDIKSTSGVCYFTVASQVSSLTDDTACFSTHNKSVAGLNTLVPGHAGNITPRIVQAGTGKSCTLRISREAFVRVLPRNIHGDGAGILIQVAAQNGKAAWLANGQTLHSAMGWIPSSEGNLSNAKKQELIAKYKDLKVFMLDKASQVPNKNLAHLHNDLQEYGNDFQAPFGDINMACFADFMQLEPIIRRQQFFAPCELPLRGLDVQLWELFRVAELTQVMRQEDGWMLHALNRMRVGEHTAEDNNPLPALRLRPPRRAQPPPPLNVLKQKQKLSAKTIHGTCIKPGGCFLLYMYLKIGMMVEYTMNYKDGDGLVNGADGVLKAVTRTYHARQTNDVEVYDVAWVRFTDPRVGQVRRRNQARFLPVGETTLIDPAWTPIERERIFLRRDKGQTAEVLQLPLLPANVRTHDRSQGMDLQAAVIDLTPPKRQQKREGLHYMARSRAKTPEGTYIVPGTYNPDDICVSRAALAAVEKAKRERPATIPYPILGTADQITVVVHNTSSLRSHREVAAHWLCMPERRHGPSPVDLIFASETNCGDDDIYDVLHDAPPSQERVLGSCTLTYHTQH
eukprot:jgi/Botrbrau1/10940/Bobra.0025s0113.1